MTLFLCIFYLGHCILVELVYGYVCAWVGLGLLHVHFWRREVTFCLTFWDAVTSLNQFGWTRSPTGSRDQHIPASPGWGYRWALSCLTFTWMFGIWTQDLHACTQALPSSPQPQAQALHGSGSLDEDNGFCFTHEHFNACVLAYVFDHHLHVDTEMRNDE